MQKSHVTAAEPQTPEVLRPMSAADLDQVLVIERGFPAPWTREMFLQELAGGGTTENRVATRGRTILGYVLWWYVADEVHIVNLAVHPAYRRRGLARVLLEEVFERGRARGMTIATLEVRSHNEAAIGLYESLAFRKVAIRKSYYADNGEDAFVMLKALGSPSPAPPGELQPGLGA